ncbi:MAG TPA: contact-dependent growth inhibition system immunity protein [Tepidisphaeraceae bacterium]|jgi:hypothetical protein|nr:contact-dependent growth inhibition system immunity protein [Tepidisphaeraceae bacterium]
MGRNEPDHLARSLEQLEDCRWAEPTFDSYLVTTCHRLRRKPLREFTVEDLRIMVGQHLGLSFLVPLSLDRLEQDPFIAGDMYPGDLLASVLRIPEAFWKSHSVLLDRTRGVVRSAVKLSQTLDQIDRTTIEEILRQMPKSFSSQ